MIELNKYQLAEKEMRLIYYRYKGLSKAKLNNSLLVSDIDAYLKKWSGKIILIKDIKKDLNERVIAVNESEAASQEDVVSIYRECLDKIFRIVVTINVLNMDKQGKQICSKIDKGIIKYCNNHDYEYY